jgi:hypothetical protein
VGASATDVGVVLGGGVSLGSGADEGVAGGFSHPPSAAVTTMETRRRAVIVLILFIAGDLLTGSG